MKHSDPSQPDLWQDTLDEGLPRDFPGQSLERMLGSAHRRKQRRMALRAGLSTALLLALLGLLLHRSPPPVTETPVVQTQPAPPPPVEVPVAIPKAPVVETISDEELLAAFGKRPVALVGSGDSKQIVLLDQKKKR